MKILRGFLRFCNECFGRAFEDDELHGKLMGCGSELLICLQLYAVRGGESQETDGKHGRHVNIGTILLRPFDVRLPPTSNHRLNILLFIT